MKIRQRAVRTGVWITVAAVGAVALASGAGTVRGQEARHATVFTATLSGFEQVPSILSNGTGTFSLTINGTTSITYRLSYSGLSSPVTQAHVHFAQRGVNGGIIFFLCGGPKPACPAAGTVTGTVVASDVNPPGDPEPVTAQGIQPGDLAGTIRAIRSGNTYANVHTTTFPGGEIRGQLAG